MKLRIRGNSIRLRLTRTEIATLGNHKVVTETTRLGPGTADQLTYSLGSHSDESKIHIRWAENTLRVNIPQGLARELADTDRVSLEETILFGDQALKVLIEKDFKCLTARIGEDESDHFENPQESHNCGTI